MVSLLKFWHLIPQNPYRENKTFCLITPFKAKLYVPAKAMITYDMLKKQYCIKGKNIIELSVFCSGPADNRHGMVTKFLQNIHPLHSDT